jgi:hypothetical protein
MQTKSRRISGALIIGIVVGMIALLILSTVITIWPH